MEKQSERDGLTNSCEHFPFEVKHSCVLVALHTPAGFLSAPCGICPQLRSREWESELQTFPRIPSSHMPLLPSLSALLSSLPALPFSLCCILSPSTAYQDMCLRFYLTGFCSNNDHPRFCLKPQNNRFAFWPVLKIFGYPRLYEWQCESVVQTNMSTTIGWIAMKLCPDTQSPHSHFSDINIYTIDWPFDA